VFREKLKEFMDMDAFQLTVQNAANFKTKTDQSA